VNFSFECVNSGIGSESGFARDCAIYVGSGHGGLLRQAVGDDGNSLSVKKVEKTVVDRTHPGSQLTDAIPQIVGLRPAQVVPEKRQPGNGRPAPVVGFEICRI
jgi:hypothetical protein